MPASPVSACSESPAGTVRQPFFAGPDGVEPAFGCQGAAGMIVSGYGCITYVSRRCAGKKLFSFESIFKLETLFLKRIFMMVSSTFILTIFFLLISAKKVAIFQENAL